MKHRLFLFDLDDTLLDSLLADLGLE